MSYNCKYIDYREIEISGIMGRQYNVPRRKRRSVSVSQVWLMPLMERFYEPNKPAFVAAGVVLLPFCIRLLLPSLGISNFVFLPFKESLPDLSDVTHSWLTPPMLFLLLNLVIGTIAFTSTNKDRHKKSKTSKNKNPGTIHWNAYGKYGERFEELGEEEEEILLPIRTPLVEPANPLKKGPKSSHESPYSPVKSHLVEPPKPPLPYLGMNKSDGPAAVNMFEVPTMEGLNSYFEDKVDDGKSPDDPSAEEVNAKADDFIQKFKQELLLQRIRSFRERTKASK